MVKYKLIYLNWRARAEAIRFIFALSDVKYEDYRIDLQDWPQHKENTPFGQLPILVIDGVELCQSHAICRYLGRQFGLAGKDELEAAQVDMVASCCEDTMSPLVAAFYEKDPDIQSAKLKHFTEEHMPRSLERLEKMLVANKGGDGYIVGDQGPAVTRASPGISLHNSQPIITWADLHIASLMTWPGGMKIPIPWEKAPKLKALCERVEAHPKIAAWIKKRPQTDL